MVTATTRFKVSSFGIEGAGENAAGVLAQRRDHKKKMGKKTQPLYDHVTIGNNAGPQILTPYDMAAGYSFPGLQPIPFSWYPGMVLPYGWSIYRYYSGWPIFRHLSGRFFIHPRLGPFARAIAGGLRIPLGVPPQLGADLLAGGGYRPLDVADVFGDHPQPNNNNPYDIDLKLPYAKYSIPAGAPGALGTPPPGILKGNYVSPDMTRNLMRQGQQYPYGLNGPMQSYNYSSFLAHKMGGYMAAEVEDLQDTMMSPKMSANGVIDQIVLPPDIARGTSFTLKILFHNDGMNTGQFRAKIQIKETDVDRMTEAVSVKPGGQGGIVVNLQMPAFIDPRSDIHSVDNDIESQLESGPDLHTHIDLLRAEGGADIPDDSENLVIHASDNNPDFMGIPPDFNPQTFGADNDNPDNSTYEDVWETVRLPNGQKGVRRHRVLSEFSCPSQMRWSPCMCRCVPEETVEPKCVHPECLSSARHGSMFEDTSSHDIRPFVVNYPPVPFPAKSPATIIASPNIVGPGIMSAGDMVSILGKRYRKHEVVDIEIHAHGQGIILKDKIDTDSQGTFKKRMSAGVLYKAIMASDNNKIMVAAIGRDSNRVAKTQITSSGLSIRQGRQTDHPVFIRRASLERQ